MKKFSVICAAALALTAPGIAQAANPDGTHTFQGTLEVRKSLPIWTPCTVTVDVAVASGVPRLQSAVAAFAEASASLASLALRSIQGDCRLLRCRPLSA